MTLHLPDHWVWDAWYAHEGDLVHAFFLHAPRSLGNPDLRHRNARVGHAVSRDLVNWELRAPVLADPPAGAPDEMATWTGSVARHDGRWLMAFSGLSPRDGGLAQRIGLAVSDDLDTWERLPVVIEADPLWYEAGSGHPEVHWRDPWIWQAPDGTVHLLITARVPHGPADGRGVIGHAWSTPADGLATWHVGPPISAPGELFQVEVPQLVRVTDDRWLVLISCRSVDHSAVRRARPGFVPATGTLPLEGPGPLGPFCAPPGPMLLRGPADNLYAGRLVEHQGRLWLMHWTDLEDGVFSGTLADPIEMELTPEHGLRAVDPAVRA